MHNPKQNNVSNMACSLYVLSNFLMGCEKSTMLVVIKQNVEKEFSEFVV